MWVIAGVLDQELSIKRLMKVSRTYERIGLVPSGYLQAELFNKREELRHMEWLQERIDKHKKDQALAELKQKQLQDERDQA